MAFDVDLHVQVPSITGVAHGEVMRSGSTASEGFSVAAKCAQFLYASKLFAAVSDWAPYYRALEVVETYYYQAKWQRDDDASITHYVFLYVIRNNAHPTSDWQITCTNLTSGNACSGQVNAGAITTGAWVQLGTISANQQSGDDYSDWKIATTVASGIGATTGVYGLSIIPDWAIALLPSAVLANDVYQMDFSYFAISEDFASTARLADAHKMLIETWRDSTGNELTSAFVNRGTGLAYNAQTGSYDLFDRLWITKPVGCKQLKARVLGAASGTVRLTFGVGVDEVQDTASIAASAWSAFTLDISALPAGIPIECRFESTANHSSLCLYWVSPPYEV